MYERKFFLLAESLFDIGVFRDKSKSPEGKGFKLKLHQKNPDAPLSPFYLDLRLIQSYPSIMKQLVSALITELNAIKVFKYGMSSGFSWLLAGIPIAATPITACLSFKTDIPMITPREPKGHGTQAKIDGYYEPGQKVVLIDDLITKADSKFEKIEILEEAELAVECVLVVVDREQGGAEEIKQAGYEFHSLFKFSELLTFYLEKSLIGDDVFHEIRNYLSK